MIDYLLTKEILFIIFAIILNVLLYKKTMKKRNDIQFIFLCGELLIFIILFINKLFNFIKVPYLDIENVACLLTILLIILNVLFINNQDDLVFKNSNSLDDNIFGYLDKKGNIIEFTKNFYEAINCFGNYEKFFKKNKVYFNSTLVNYKELLNSIKNCFDEFFKLTVEVNDIINDKEYSFNIQKLIVEKDDKVIGYTLINLVNESETNFVDGFNYVIDELDIPYAYYNNESRNVIYTVNKKFKDLLGIKGRTITYSELKNLVFKDDIDEFNNGSNEYFDKNKFTYRLKTSIGYKNFEEVKINKDDQIISIITLGSDINNLYCDKEKINLLVNDNIQNNKKFGGIIVSLNSFVDLFNTRGIDFAKELSRNFVEYVKNNILKENDKICKISDIEYLLYFEDMNNLDYICRDIVSGVSALIKYDFYYGDEIITSNNKIGIVYSDNINSSDNFFSNLDMALSFANNVDYDKNYCVYQAGYKKEKPIKITKGSYSFDNIKIDLDNSFLDDDEI